MSTRRSARPVTIMDVAKRAGVSFKTVSRVINEEPNVRPEMREKVQRVVAALGYRPNVSARALAGSRSFMLALVGSDPSIGYTSALQAGAAAACREAGYHLIFEPVEIGDAGASRQVEELLATQRLDGVIVAVPTVDDERVLAAIERAGVPCVRVAPDRALDRSSYVHFDERRATAEMTEHLWSLGHRHIGFVRGYPGHAAARLRTLGFQEALERLGGDIRPAWMASGRFDFRSGVAAGEAILGRGERPTAVFASNDDMALGIISVANRLGLSVPGDLSVAGFDDIQLATVVWPQLTTVRQPIREMAAAAVKMLTSGTRGAGEPEIRMLDYEIVVRGTTAPPRSGRIAATPARGRKRASRA